MFNIDKVRCNIKQKLMNGKVFEVGWMDISPSLIPRKDEYFESISMNALKDKWVVSEVRYCVRGILNNAIVEYDIYIKEVV